MVFHPQTPQGGLINTLHFGKSPSGDLGVKSKRGLFWMHCGIGVKRKKDKEFIKTESQKK
jgi:hypothetical protein